MQSKAVAKTVRMSPRKARLVTDQIRGLSVEEASNLLRFDPQKGATYVAKVLESAVANAEYNEGANVDDLFVSEVFVNEGFTLKGGWRPRARGRADKIRKRTCHITVAVSDEPAK